jgi:hypothetical protein
MDENDGRRPRVPAGTFGGSDPPPVPTSDASETAESGGAERKRFTSTLTGKDGDANVDELEAELVAPEIGTAPALRGDAPMPTRPRTTGNTLVGHPSVPQTPPSGPVAPVLAPPKWRGAKPYLEGEEPQPHLSAIPTPPPVPSTPSVRPVGEPSMPMLRSRVTTKVGQPPAVQPPTAPIDDTIQRMLEGQASVPMQVEEPLDIAAIPEIAVDDLPIEMLADSSPRLPPAMVAAARARAQESAAAAGAKERSAATARAVAAAPAQPKPRPGPERAADVEFGFASSVAPAEITRRPRKDDSHPGLGVLALAVFTVVFVGGWFLTRGGYSRTQHKQAVVSAPAATAKPSGPSDLAPAPAKALTTPEPEPEPEAEAEADDRELTAAEQSERAQRPTRRTRTGSRTGPSGAQTEEASADDASEARGADRTPPTPSAPSTLEVQPRVDPADLPDIPSREDVIAALEPLRGAIGECVHGRRGVAQLDITVSSTGSVSHAVVGGDFAGTPEGSCIARATRTAQFTPFKKPRFRVIYPFGL